MKKISKFLGILLIMALVMSMGITAAFATEPPADPPAQEPAASADGSITITNATLGQTYEAWLIFTASPSNPSDLSAGVTYTATEAQTKISGFTDVFDVFEDANGNFTVAKKSTVQDNAVITFIKDNFDALKQGSAITGTYSDDSTVVFDGLDYGYYYITSTLGSLITIDTAGIDVQVVDKNESTPTPPDKEITAEDSAIAEGQDQSDVNLEENAASVGSVETFTITFDATNWVQTSEANTAGTGTGTKTQVTEWNFKDTPTNLEINASSVQVFVNGTAAANEITSTITDIAVDATSGVLTFTIPWVDADGKSLYETKTQGSALIPVTITYTATVLADAAYSPAPNTIDVKYNNDTDLGNDTTTTYTYKFDLKKVDENSAALDGAEFELYYGTTADDDAPALTFTVDADGKYRFDPNGTETHIKPTGTDAIAHIVGLDDANYMLREVVVPSGYNKVADTPVTGLTKEDGQSTADPTLITVQNLKGTELPSTGGIGTTIFYVVGSILVVAAGVLLITKKRMSREG